MKARHCWSAALTALVMAVSAPAVLADADYHDQPGPAAAPASDPEHGGPPGAASRAAPGGMAMMDMPMMKQHMQQMMAGMKKIHAAKTSAERSRLMEDQMQLMTDQMDMMTRMMEMMHGGGSMMQGGGAKSK